MIKKHYYFIPPLGQDKNSKKLRKLLKEFENNLNFVANRKQSAKFTPTNKKLLKQTAGIIVSYNDIDSLKDLLSDLTYQTALPEFLVIFDNSSQDGTKEFVFDFFNLNKNTKKIPTPPSFSNTTIFFKQIKNIKIYYLLSKKNIGGAGGFANSLMFAKTILKAHYAFTMDSDIRIPPKLLESIYQHKKTRTILGCTMLQSKEPLNIIESGSSINKESLYNEVRKFDIKFIGHYSNRTIFSVLHDVAIKTYIEIPVDYQPFCFSLIDIRQVSMPILKNIKQFFIHLDDIYLNLQLKLTKDFKVYSLVNYYYWHNAGSVTPQHFSLIRMYDFRNFIYLVKTLYPEKLKVVKRQVLKDLSIFVFQAKYKLVDKMLKLYDSALRGKLGIIKGNLLKQISKKDFTKLLSRTTKITINLRYETIASYLSLQENLISKPKKKFYLLLFSYNEISQMNQKDFPSNTVVFYWDKKNLLSRILLFLKSEIIISNFDDMPRLASLIPNKTIIFFQKKDEDYNLYITKTSPIKTIKLLLKLVYYYFFK